MGESIVIDTVKRIKEHIAKVKEIMETFNCSQETAWAMLGSSEAQKALEVAERIEERQRKISDAMRHAAATQAAQLPKD